MLAVSFYRFVAIDEPEALRRAALRELLARGVKGTLLIAPEGVNGALAGAREGVHGFLEWLRGDARFAGLVAREAAVEAMPFRRTKVKVRREIVTLGVPGLDPADGGKRVAPRDWNALVRDPATLLVDCRNDYEVDLGSFPGAVNPGTGSFREFPGFAEGELDPARHSKVAIFCTGGIRCEKAGAFLRRAGFGEVFQLEGGILGYLEEVPVEESLWEGECFVFDDRGVLGTR